MYKGKFVLAVVVLGIGLATGWFAQGTQAQVSGSVSLYAPLIANRNPIPVSSLRALLVSDRDGNEEIYLATPGGLPAQRLTNNPIADTGPLLSPDRRTILYRSGSTEADTSLYLMNVDGTNRRQLVGLAGFETNYQWSPKGDQILFHAGSVTDTTLYVISASGGNPRALANKVYESSAWSPDGNLIAYSTNSVGDYEVWVVKPDGTGARQLSNNVTDEYFVDWLDGGREMLVNTFNGNDYDIYLYKTDGSGFKGAVVTAASTVAIESSPNRHYWLYEDETYNVGIVDAYTSQRIVIPNTCPVSSCSFGNYAWSPHGNEEVAYIFTANPSDSSVYRIRFTAEAPSAELLIEDAEAVYWSPNPNYLLYIRSVAAPTDVPDFYYPILREIATRSEVELGTATTRTSFHGWAFGN